MGSDNGAGCVVITAIVMIIAVMLLSGISGALDGIKIGEKRIRADAVERGYGEWVPDKNGKTTFKWKE